MLLAESVIFTMGYDVQWLGDDKRIILIRFELVWTWDEVFEVIEAIHTMMESVDRKTCTIWDLTNIATLPANTLKNLKRANELYHLLSWYSALVGMPRVFKPIYQVYERLQGFGNPFGLYLYDTVPEAQQAFEELIAQADSDD